jgi:hypothetical protein
MIELPHSSLSFLITENQEQLAELNFLLESFQGEFKLIFARCNYLGKNLMI